MPSAPSASGTAGFARARRSVEQESHGLWHTIRANRAVLVRIGGAAALLSALRASRQVIIPLWALSIGVGDTTTAVIIGIAGAVDFALFYTSGWIMDRFGRLWSALPVSFGLAAGHFILALTHDLTTNFIWFIVAAIVLAISNGFGSGIVLTLGADLADRRNPAPFLGAFRFTVNTGGAMSPLLISGLTALVSLSFAAAGMGVLGLIGAGLFLRYIPRFVPHPKRTSG